MDNLRLPILRYDCVFKHVFKNSPKALVYLINNITGSDYKEEDLIFIDTEVEGESIKNKVSFIDIYVEDKVTHEKVLIEMQNVMHTDFANRRILLSNKNYNR